jgi:hypothetical protein
MHAHALTPHPPPTYPPPHPSSTPPTPLPRYLQSLPSVGDAVYQSFSVLGGESWFRGVVKVVHLASGTVDIDFDDGDKLSGVRYGELVAVPPPGAFVPSAQDLRVLASVRAGAPGRCVCERCWRQGRLGGGGGRGLVCDVGTWALSVGRGSGV